LLVCPCFFTSARMSPSWICARKRTSARGHGAVERSGTEWAGHRGGSRGPG
jgi:hypothetical protein